MRIATAAVLLTLLAYPVASGKVTWKEKTAKYHTIHTDAASGSTRTKATSDAGRRGWFNFKRIFGGICQKSKVGEDERRIRLGLLDGTPKPSTAYDTTQVQSGEAPASPVPRAKTAAQRAVKAAAAAEEAAKEDAQNLAFCERWFKIFKKNLKHEPVKRFLEAIDVEPTETSLRNELNGLRKHLDPRNRKKNRVPELETLRLQSSIAFNLQPLETPFQEFVVQSFTVRKSDDVVVANPQVTLKHSNLIPVFLEAFFAHEDGGCSDKRDPSYQKLQKANTTAKFKEGLIERVMNRNKVTGSNQGASCYDLGYLLLLSMKCPRFKSRAKVLQRYKKFWDEDTLATLCSNIQNEQESQGQDYLGALSDEAFRKVQSDRRS